MSEKVKKTLALDPTAGKQYRRATLSRLSSGRRFVGILEVTEAWKEGLTESSRRYAVLEIGGERGDRVFRVAKAGSAEPPYHVRLAPAGGGYDECDCVAHERYGRCVHSESLRVHLDAGTITPNREGAFA